MAEDVAFAAPPIVGLLSGALGRPPRVLGLVLRRRPHQPLARDTFGTLWPQFIQTAHDAALGRRGAEGRKGQPAAAIFDSCTLQSTPESGPRAGYDGAKRKRGSKVHRAVDTLGHLLALHVTAAKEQDRGQMEQLADAVQAVTGDSVEVAFVDQGYTGDQPAAAPGLQLEVVKLPEVKKGFMRLPRCWVVAMIQS
jgi:transposase